MDVELWILRYLSLLALLVHTKVQILTPEELLRRQAAEDAAAGLNARAVARFKERAHARSRGTTGGASAFDHAPLDPHSQVPQFACFTSTKVQILTPEELLDPQLDPQLWGESAAERGGVYGGAWSFGMAVGGALEQLGGPWGVGGGSKGAGGRGERVVVVAYMSSDMKLSHPIGQVSICTFVLVKLTSTKIQILSRICRRI